MEVSNERKDSLGAQESDLGGGKDLLYGWLVGRAAADLGLAQALVVSEAQRSEQIKRLEDSLLGQIRELEKRQTSNPNTNGSTAEMAALKAELERFSERQHKLETERIDIDQLEAVIRAKLREFEPQTPQQGQHHVGSDLGDFKLDVELLTDRVARVEFSNQQAQAQSASEFRRIEDLVNRLIRAESESLKSKIIEEVSQQQPWPPFQETQAEWAKTLDEIRREINQTSGNSELNALRNDLVLLSQRLDQLELMPNPATAVVDELNRWSKDVNERMGARIDALVDEVESKIQIISGVKAERESQVAEAAVKMLEESVDRRISDLNDKLVAAVVTLDSRDAEMRGLNDQLINLAERVAELTNCVDDRTARDGERQELTLKFEEDVAERIYSLESRLAEKLDQREPVDGSQFQMAMSALANRVAQVELVNQQAQSVTDGEAARSQQAVEALQKELAATKVELGQNNLECTQRLIQGLEETLSAKLQQLESVLARQQQDGQRRDALLSEVRSEMQVLTQRLAQAESSVQRTHTLMVTEAAQTAQLREGVLSDLMALQTRLAERESHDRQFESLSRDLNARLFEIQDQLKEKSVLFSGRDGEIAQLRLEVQKLTQMIAPMPTGHAETVTRAQAPSGVTGVLGVKAQPEALQTLKPASAGNEPISLLQTYNAEMVGSNDLKKQLQQRMSADVERVRAELRKRAGVSR